LFRTKIRLIIHICVLRRSKVTCKFCLLSGIIIGLQVRSLLVVAPVKRVDA